MDYTDLEGRKFKSRKQLCRANNIKDSKYEYHYRKSGSTEYALKKCLHDTTTETTESKGISQSKAETAIKGIEYAVDATKGMDPFWIAVMGAAACNDKRKKALISPDTMKIVETMSRSPLGVCYDIYKSFNEAYSFGQYIEGIRKVRI